MDDGLRGEMEVVDVHVPAFRAESSLWTRVVEAGLEDAVRVQYAEGIGKATSAIFGVCALLERHGIRVDRSWVTDGRTPVLLREQEGGESAT